MNIFLLQWGMFLFMIGLILSLPLASVYYLNHRRSELFFINPQKLKSAHLDYFTQAFSIGFAYLLSFSIGAHIPVYITIPLAFGTFCNPFILLIEATPLYKRGFISTLYKLLKIISPASLYFAWFVLFFKFLPSYFMWIFGGVISVLIIAIYKGTTLK